MPLPTAGFQIGTGTAWRYVRRTADLLALADDLNAATDRAAALMYAIMDGTLIPIDRVADQKLRGSRTRRALWGAVCASRGYRHRR
jgi:hypothetical protein